MIQREPEGKRLRNIKENITNGETLRKRCNQRVKGGLCTLRGEEWLYWGQDGGAVLDGGGMGRGEGSPPLGTVPNAGPPALPESPGLSRAVKPSSPAPWGGPEG